jgi:hypothetical protein
MGAKFWDAIGTALFLASGIASDGHRARWTRRWWKSQGKTGVQARSPVPG